MVNLCVPTLTQYELLHKLILSAEQGSVVPDAYWIVDNGGTLNIKLPADLRKKVKVHRPDYNLGVAGSWNWFLTNLEDSIVISNDDVELLPDSMESILHAAELEPEVPFFCPGGMGSGWSFFLQRKHTVDTVGLYDSNFWPAYFEDNDYSYRLRLAGYTIRFVESLSVNHKESSTLNSYSEDRKNRHHEEFRRNRSYYILKWGGDPGAETYTTPFGT